MSLIRARYRAVNTIMNLPRGGFVGLLDLFPNAAAAYSLRLLRKDYSGGLVRARAWDGVANQGEAEIMPRRIDAQNYVVDLNSKLEDLDATAISRGLTTNDTLADLVLSGTSNYDGLVSGWRDQSLSNDATQTTAANQPKIVSAGSLVTENAKAAIDFDGVNDFYEISGVMGGAVNGMMISVHKTNDGTTTFDSCQISDSSPVAIPIAGNNHVSMAHLTGTRVIASTANNYYNRQLLVVRENYNGDHKLHIDGETVITSTNAISYTDVLKIGRVKNGGAYSYYDNKLQEVIVYPSNQSANRTGIEGSINEYYNIY